MDKLFLTVSRKCSKIITTSYSTSFSLGIRFLSGKFHAPIYAIYGFVRFADEIVDTHHGYDQKLLLENFHRDTYDAIRDKISLNPVLNSFQQTVHQYAIENELIDTFMDSMRMDLSNSNHDKSSYEKYILGSAEVVGLMCLRVFCENNPKLYDQLKPFAMKLGAAFQKVNFLRDLKEDKFELGRSYFPGVDLVNFTHNEKARIESEIEADFREALEGIRRLPVSSRRGVYLAYCYYLVLFRKIRNLPPQRILSERIRIPNTRKLAVMVESVLRYNLNLF